MHYHHKYHNPISEVGFPIQNIVACKHKMLATFLFECSSLPNRPHCVCTLKAQNARQVFIWLFLSSKIDRMRLHPKGALPSQIPQPISEVGFPIQNIVVCKHKMPATILFECFSLPKSTALRLNPKGALPSQIL